MPDPIEPNRPGIDPLPDTFSHRGIIIADLLCAGCDYNLRTLETRARCPECGRRVADSIPVHSLRPADLPWLKRLVRGARALTIAWAMALLAALVDCFSLRLGSAPIQLILLVTLGFFVRGAWLITSPRPGTSRKGHLRITARIVCILAVLPTCQLFSAIFFTWNWRESDFNYSIPFVVFFAVPASQLLLLGHIYRLADELRSLPLAALAEAAALLSVPWMLSMMFCREVDGPNPAYFVGILFTVGMSTIYVLVFRGLARSAGSSFARSPSP